MKTDYNNWLIISYFSNIDGAAQAHWVDDRIRWLEKKSVDVNLLSSFCGGKHKGIYHKRALSISPADFKYELDFILKRKGISGFLFKFLRILIFLPLYPLYYLETKVFNLYGESRWSWTPLAILVGYFMYWRNRKINVIYSTGGPASAHIIAAILSKLIRLPWIAELQDPFVGEDIGRNSLSKKGLAFIERFIFKNADKVIFCTKAACKSAGHRHPSGKAVFIYPGANPPAAMPVVTNTNHDKCRFVYLGSLYQTRNLDQFLKALRMVFQERSDLVERFKLELYGNICSEDIKARIERFPYDVIAIKGLVSRHESLACANQSDVLLLIQNTDLRSSETIPCKVYEYLQSRNKILGLVYRNEELHTMLSVHGHMAVAADDPQQIKLSIIKLLDEWLTGKLNADWQPCELTVERAVDDMLNIVSSLDH